jgi:hypothetical protein
MRRFIVLCMLLAGCAGRNKEEMLRNDLVGEWRNVFLDVTMNTFQNGDSTRVTTCDSSNWEQMLHIKPIRTFFSKDGTYHSDYYSLNDSLLFSASGTWRVSHDTLIMDQLKPRPNVYKLQVSVADGLARFDGLLDFDEDGQKDDHYVGRQRKQ